jgi:hypothetical protein
MQPYQQASETVVFYDRHIRLWTAYKLDAEGNQIGLAGYGPTKESAIRDYELGVLNATRN